MARYAVSLIHPLYGEQDTMHDFATRKQAVAYGRQQIEERGIGGTYRIFTVKEWQR